jgi:tetratricopeptide (TPR) repeat protein
MRLIYGRPHQGRRDEERHTARNIAGGIGLGVLLAVGSMVEGPAAMTAAYARTNASYDAKTDPYRLNDRLAGIARGLTGSPEKKVEQFFKKHKKGASGWKGYVKGAGRPPRTAAETLADGGDCTDFSTLSIAVLRSAGIQLRAMVVHFDNAPANEDHMVPYVMSGENRTIIDLQAKNLGETAQGGYTVLMDLSSDQAAEMYHRKWGDYSRDTKKPKDALRAYKRALEIYEKDAYVHQNLGVLYEKAGDMEAAARHFRRAAQLNPSRYAKDTRRGSYNEELQKGEKAYNEKRWADCARHFQNALDSGEKIKDAERKVIEQYRNRCRKNAGQ